MNFLKGFGVLILALILQQTLVRLISIGAIKPDLVMIILVAVAFRYGSLTGLFCGMAIGLMQDVYSIENLGANALAKCLVGYFAGLLDEKVVKIMPATKVLVLGAAFLVHDVVFSVAAGFRGRAFWEAMLGRTAPSGLYTLLAGALVFYFVITPSKSEA